jgi:hypothetical protein
MQMKYYIKGRLLVHSEHNLTRLPRAISSRSLSKYSVLIVRTTRKTQEICVGKMQRS